MYSSHSARLYICQIKAQHMTLSAKLILKTNKTILPDTPIPKWLCQSVSSGNHDLKQFCLPDQHRHLCTLVEPSSGHIICIVKMFWFGQCWIYIYNAVQLIQRIRTQLLVWLNLLRLFVNIVSTYSYCTSPLPYLCCERYVCEYHKLYLVQKAALPYLAQNYSTQKPQKTPPMPKDPSKALSTLIHSTSLVQSRSFNKF